MFANPSSNQLRHTLFILNSSIIVGIVLGIAIAFSSPGIVALALVIGLSIVLVVKNPVVGILAFIGLTSTVLDSATNPGIFLGFGHIYLSDIILFVLFWLIGWGMLTHLEAKFYRTPLDIPLLLFVVVALVSTSIAMINGIITLQDSLGPMRDILNLMIFFAVTNLVKTNAQIKLLRRSIIAFACVVSVVMVIQYFLGTNLPFLPGRVEVLSTEGVSYSSVTRIIPPGFWIVFVTFVTGCSIWFFDKKHSGNLILAIPLALTGLGVLLTFKRHFWVSLVVIFLIIALISNRKELQRILIRGFATFAVMLLGLFFIMNYTGSVGPDLVAGSFNRVASLFRADTYEDPNSSLRWRDFENEYAVPQIISHPFIGIGLGTKYRPWVPNRDWSDFDGRAFIHNGFYWLLLRTGGIGFLSMMGVLVAVVVRGFKYWRIVPDGAYVLGFTLAIIGLLIGNWVEPLISEWYCTALLAALIGVNELSIRYKI